MSPGKNDVAKGPQPLLTKTWAALQRRKAKTENSPQDRQIRRINPGVFVRKCLGPSPRDFCSASNPVSIHTLRIFEFNYYHRKGFTWFYPANQLPSQPCLFIALSQTLTHLLHPQSRALLWYATVAAPFQPWHESWHEDGCALSSETLCLLTAVHKLTHLLSNPLKTHLLLEAFPAWVLYFCTPVLCHRCNWGCWDVDRQVSLCLNCALSYGSSHWGWRGFVERAGTLESGMNLYSSSTREFSNSFWLSFVTLELLLFFSCVVVFHPCFSRQLCPPRCTFLLSLSGQRALF